MWVIFGNKVKTERVPDGRKIEKLCPACHETAMFYERRATTTFQVYFLDVYDYKTQRVMACGACGALFATDELGGAGAPVEEVTPGRVLDSVFTAAQRAGQAIQAGTARALHTIGEELDEMATNVREHSREGTSEAPRAPEPGPEAEIARQEGEPRVLSDEDAELLKRFEALERTPRKD